MILHPIQPRNSRFHIRSLPSLGSDRLAIVLGRRLDDGYHYFRKVTPAGLAEIETIVVGPGGTWTVMRVGLHGRFRRRNGHWYRWNGSTSVETDSGVTVSPVFSTVNTARVRSTPVVTHTVPS